MFDSSENSKIIKFSLKDKDYNAYLKYSALPQKSTVGGNTITRWDISFSEKERDKLKYEFEELSKENIVVLVCTNKNLKSEDSLFAIIDLETANKCLELKKTRISIKSLFSIPSHTACLHLFRHILRIFLAIRKYGCGKFTSSDEKSDGAPRARRDTKQALKELKKVCIVTVRELLILMR